MEYIISGHSGLISESNPEIVVPPNITIVFYAAAHTTCDIINREDLQNAVKVMRDEDTYERVHGGSIVSNYVIEFDGSENIGAFDIELNSIIESNGTCELESILHFFSSYGEIILYAIFCRGKIDTFDEIVIDNFAYIHEQQDQDAQHQMDDPDAWLDDLMDYANGKKSKFKNKSKRKPKRKSKRKSKRKPKRKPKQKSNRV
jgi:hypothetical protein